MVLVLVVVTVLLVSDSGHLVATGGSDGVVVTVLRTCGDSVAGVMLMAVRR